MTTPEPSTAAPAGGASDLLRVLDDYLADLQAGQAPDRAGALRQIACCRSFGCIMIDSADVFQHEERVIGNETPAS